MPLYEADPNNSKKQIPKAKGDNAYDRVRTPNRCGLTKTPNAVIIGNLTGDNVSFFFGSSASYSATANLQADFPAQGVLHNGLDGVPTGSIITSSFYEDFGKPAAGTTLNIHPTAYSCSKADSTQIHFVYSSGLRTGPY
tara:strand:- start:11 stop:427 length:417 start_codon:yes stop_codon:yes gene_type:complete